MQTKFFPYQHAQTIKKKKNTHKGQTKPRRTFPKILQKKIDIIP